MKLVTKKYKDGSKISYEWFDVLDGPWPYESSCEEVIFNMNINNPAYE